MSSRPISAFAYSLFAISLLNFSPLASPVMGQQKESSADAEEMTVANDDQFEVFASASLIIGPRDLLKNDVAVKKRKLHVCDYDDGELLGELQVRSGIGFVYLPGSSFKQLLRSETKTETFKYQVHDGSGGSDWATVQIKVKGTKPRPADYSGKWDVNLTAKVHELIESEVAAMGERAKEKLTPAELAGVEKEIDLQLDSLRKWSKSSTLMWKDSTGPFFNAFFRVQKTGADMKAAPFMTTAFGIGGMEFGFGQDGNRRQFKGRFDWTSRGGSFVKEWTEEDPVDEEFRLQVTGRLRIEIEVEKTLNGKVIRVAESVDKNVIENHGIALRGSDAVKQAVIYSTNTTK